MLLLSRTLFFNAAHRLYREDRSPEWNAATYGDAAAVNGYGHNYALEVFVEGWPDEDSGMVINLRDLDRVLKEEVDRKLDHRHLNHEIEGFQDRAPTAENLAQWIWDKVEARLVSEGWPCRIAQLSLRATPSFAVELSRRD